MKQDKPYQILKCNNDVQAVKDKATGVTAAVFFKPANNINWGPLKEVKNPCYVMFKGKDNLALSLNTPNLAGFTGHRKTKAQDKLEMLSRQITIVLRGKWHSTKLDKRAKIKYLGYNTHITGSFRHGKPIQINLKKK